MTFFKCCLVSLLLMTQVAAADSTVLTWDTGKNLETSYDVVYKSLEDNNFFVVFEPDIQKNLSFFAERWGDNYNRNKLEGIRSMIFCNGWYANAVSNADPDMMALCPLHITLVQKAGVTRILFSRPTVIAAGSKALSVAREIEQDVSKALDEAVAKLKP
ncbi:hypothetical protein MNBD_GAMMA13-1766 [hydrothermal vent metagenome]|uniref:DUF302 domain-containing protein n=1 Tax=hydrothermal vent metagenome TaxID=652676 RepID=A0A3B0YDR1_9ZZZZ